MSVAAWSLVWQTVAAGACVSFFALAIYITRGAIRDAVDMFRDLRDDKSNAE